MSFHTFVLTFHALCTGAEIMSTDVQPVIEREIVYPESDGQPMADNTLQFRWIVTIQGGLDALFRDAPDVFVAGDLLWYPVQGEPTIRLTFHFQSAP